MKVKKWVFSCSIYSFSDTGVLYGFKLSYNKVKSDEIVCKVGSVHGTGMQELEEDAEFWDFRGISDFICCEKGLF